MSQQFIVHIIVPRLLFFQHFSVCFYYKPGHGSMTDAKPYQATGTITEFKAMSEIKTKYQSSRKIPDWVGIQERGPKHNTRQTGAKSALHLQVADRSKWRLKFWKESKIPSGKKQEIRIWVITEQERHDREGCCPAIQSLGSNILHKERTGSKRLITKSQSKTLEEYVLNDPSWIKCQSGTSEKTDSYSLPTPDNLHNKHIAS